MSAPHHDFVDVQQGMKLQVVIPILRSGGYIVPSVKRSSSSHQELEVGDDFLGYERVHYKVRPRDSGIRIQLDRTQLWTNGKTHRRPYPRLNLFSDAENSKHVRLVYLVRLSNADHNMAIIASDELAALDELTRSVTQKSECRSSQKGTCQWVPEGIAVILDPPQSPFAHAKPKEKPPAVHRQ